MWLNAPAAATPRSALYNCTTRKKTLPRPTSPPSVSAPLLFQPSPRHRLHPHAKHARRASFAISADRGLDTPQLGRLFTLDGRRDVHRRRVHLSANAWCHPAAVAQIRRRAQRWCWAAATVAPRAIVDTRASEVAELDLVPSDARVFARGARRRIQQCARRTGDRRHWPSVEAPRGPTLNLWCST